jgi:protein-disulfide isomerase
MSNRTKEQRSRRENRRQAKKQGKINQVILIIGGLIAFVALMAIVSSSGSGPEVASERLNLDPVLGNPDAPVTIIEYAAYSCTACRSWYNGNIIQQILNDYPDQVNFVHRDFPVITPAYDRRAAEMAQCALDQGQDQFWDYHAALFRRFNSGDSIDDLLLLGEEVGLDSAALSTCVNDNTHRATVQYNEQRGHDLGLRGTPAFLVNGELLYGPTPDSLRTAVERALTSVSS